MAESKKTIGEKLQEKAIEVAGKVAEEGVKQILGIGGAFAWLIKLGALATFLVVVGVIALIVYLIVRFT